MDEIKIQSIDQPNSEIIFFLNSVLPFPYNNSTFNWEYNHPHKVFQALRYKTKIVGVQGLIPIEITQNNHILLSAKSETSYVDTSIKGKGFFKKLYNNVVNTGLENNIDFIWGLTSLGKVWDKLGFQTKNNFIVISTLSLRADKTVFHTINHKSIIIKTLKFCKYAFNSYKLRYQLFKSKKKDQQMLSEKIISDQLFGPNDIIDLHDNFMNSSIKIKMTKTYMDYRLKNNPFLKYEVKYLYDNNKKLQGYSILSKKNGIANLVDVFAESQEIKKLLVNINLRQLLKSGETYRLNVFGNKENNYIAETFHILKQYGATKYDTQLYFVLKNHSIGEIKNWYINGLWTEGINQ